MACERAKRKQFNWYELKKYEGRKRALDSFVPENDSVSKIRQGHPPKDVESRFHHLKC